MAHSNTDEQQVRNLRMRQTWLEELISAICDEHGFKSPDEAFRVLVYSLLFEVNYDSVPPEDIIDGGGDKQLDIIRIDDDPETSSAHISIVQTKKTTDGFSPVTLVNMKNGISWLLERPRSEYLELSNKLLVDKIDEIRELRLNYGPSNIDFSVYYVTLGDAQDLAEEYLQELRAFINIYNAAGFNTFTFRELGAFELIEIVNQSDRVNRVIDVDIPIVYDVNQPSLLEYSAGDTEACVCTVKGDELAKVASKEPRDAIFDRNVRPFYGAYGRVNGDIWATCTSSKDSGRFWFLNNGVTMTCDRFNVVRDPDRPMVKVYNAQIVNGCQTTVTLREAWEKGELKEDVRVLLRIYATDNPSLVNKITLTTNNQNQVTSRDLKANDPVQIDIQRVMQEKYDLFYERKNKEFRGFRGSQRKRIVPNYKAAQAYLAIVRNKPSIARGYLLRIWSDYYNEIFSNATVDDLVLSYLIYQYCVDKAKLAKSNSELSNLDIEISIYGTFHLARICGYYLTQDKWGYKYHNDITSLIRQIEDDPNFLESYYLRSLDTLREIRMNTIIESPNPTLYFKASDIQRQISKALYGSTD